MPSNQRFTMKDLLNNSSLSNVFPQFGKNDRLQNVYSYAEVERRVLEYLKNALNGTVTGSGELTVNGKHKVVIRQIRGMHALIESFFNNMPSVVKNLRKNTKLYTPFSTVAQIKDLQSIADKAAALKVILDNINYNPDFNSQNAVASRSPLPYRYRQEMWKKKVGYKE